MCDEFPSRCFRPNLFRTCLQTKTTTSLPCLRPSWGEHESDFARSLSLSLLCKILRVIKTATSERTNTEPYANVGCGGAAMNRRWCLARRMEAYQLDDLSGVVDGCLCTDDEHDRPNERTKKEFLRTDSGVQNIFDIFFFTTYKEYLLLFAQQ